MAKSTSQKTHSARKAARVKRRRPLRKSPKPRSLLILECDAVQLASQAISLACDLADVTTRFVADATTLSVPATSQQELLARLGECKEKHDRFDLIVVIGHANQAGIRFTADRCSTWDEFAQWLVPFQPRRVVLVACEAGRWLPSSALFAGIPTLDEIYGSPIVTTQQQASAVKLLVPYLLSGGRLPKDILLMQATNFFLTGGILFRQTRAEFRRAGPVDGAIWTGFEELLNAALAGRR